jgi:hypothetical protein
VDGNTDVYLQHADIQYNDNAFSDDVVDQHERHHDECDANLSDREQHV